MNATGTLFQRTVTRFRATIARRRQMNRGNSAVAYRAVGKLKAGSYLMRTTAPAPELAAGVRQIAREELPTAPVAALMTLAQIETVEMRKSRAV